MKKGSIFVICVVAALLSSCLCGGKHSSVASLYVVDDAGRPLEGVILEPVGLQYGCQCYPLTGPCGRAAVGSQRHVNLRRGGFNSVLGVHLDPSANTYVQMESQGFGDRDRPRGWSGGSPAK